MASRPSGSHVDELKAFRDEWRNELNHTPATQHAREALLKRIDSGGLLVRNPEVPFPFQFTDNLLQTWQDVPNKNKAKTVKHPASDTNESSECKKSRESLVDIYLEDLNDLNNIPFFDVGLPREIALKIFAYLDVKELCHCAQVSQAWRSLADDNIIWEQMYRRWRHTFTTQTNIKASEHWKQTVSQCFIRTRLLKSHWQEHKCHVTFYHHARGGVLTSADARGDYLMAGYTSGQVKLWNLETDESHTLEPCNKSLVIVDEAVDDILSTSENSITCVKIGKNRKIIAGYNHGYVQLWDCENMRKASCLNYPNQRIAGVGLSDSEDIGYAHVRGANGSCEIQVTDVGLFNDGVTHLDTIAIRDPGASWSLPKEILVPLVMDGSESSSLLFLKRDSIMIHHISTLDKKSSTSVVEHFYGTHFTCLNASEKHVSVGLTSHLGVHAEYKVRCYDPENLRHSIDLRSHTSQVTCVDNCNNGFLIATGCHDRRVRLFDSRAPVDSVKTFAGHAGSVECVLVDEWKIISGDTEGYIFVWDQRLSARLWESQSRHPVKLLKFTTDRLIAANIPNQYHMEDADSDRMTHIRYRGRLQVSDFSVWHPSSTVPSICSSSYDAPEASTYNISLITPYDVI